MADSLDNDGKFIGFIKKVNKSLDGLDEVDKPVKDEKSGSFIKKVERILDTYAKDEPVKDENHSKVDEPYGAMWVIPIFLGLLGGILGYIALKDHDQKRANDMMSYGIYSTVISIVLIIFIYIGSSTMN